MIMSIIGGILGIILCYVCIKLTQDDDKEKQKQHDEAMQEAMFLTGRYQKK